jgi:hypothetical protein
MTYFGAESWGKALTNCCPVHCADGLSFLKTLSVARCELR